MAAPDFPASPTVGQTYTAPSGLVYTWDGQVWNTSGGVASTYWTDTGTALTPTTVTRRVAVPGPTATGADMSNLIVGSRTIKGRLHSRADADYSTFMLNRYWDGSAYQRDDATKPAWTLALDPTNDNATFVRTPVSGAAAALLTLDNGGRLTNKATACVVHNNGTNQSIPATTWTPLTMSTNGGDSSGGVLPNLPTGLKAPATASWMIIAANVSLTANVTGYLSIEYFFNSVWSTYTYSTFYQIGQAVTTVIENPPVNTPLRTSIYTLTAATVSWAIIQAAVLGTQ